MKTQTWDTRGNVVFYQDEKDIEHLIAKCETSKDACLIAAAPDCYESLREILEAFYERVHNSKWTDNDKEMIKDAENALAKAEGKACA